MAHYFGSRDMLVTPPCLFIIPLFHHSTIPLVCLRHIALEIHRLLFVNMGSLISYHGDAGIFIKIVFIVFAAVVDEQVLFLINQL